MPAHARARQRPTAPEPDCDRHGGTSEGATEDERVWRVPLSRRVHAGSVDRSGPTAATAACSSETPPQPLVAAAEVAATNVGLVDARFRTPRWAVAHSATRAGPRWPPPTSTPPSLRSCPSAGAHPGGKVDGGEAKLTGGSRRQASGTVAALTTRAAFQRAGSSAATSLSRTPRASRGRTSARYSTGFTSASAQEPSTV